MMSSPEHMAVESWLLALTPWKSSWSPDAFDACGHATYEDIFFSTGMLLEGSLP